MSEATAERQAAPPKPIATKSSMVPHIGPLATRNCEPRQARKGAAAAVASCAGVWLV